MWPEVRALWKAVMQNDSIESLHSDWQPLEQVCRLSLLLELSGDPVPQLSNEVNSRFIDQSQYLQRSAEMRMRLGIGVPRILQWRGSRGGGRARGPEVPQWGPGAKSR